MDRKLQLVHPCLKQQAFDEAETDLHLAESFILDVTK